jgi:predicted peptidase
VTFALFTTVLAAPATAITDPETVTGVDFTLGAEVLDGGQQITSLTVDTSSLGGVDPASLDPDTFAVYATATSPIDGAQPLLSEYDVHRTVTDVQVDASGNTVLTLEHGPGVLGASTLAYSLPLARNLALDITYTVQQLEPITTATGTEILLEDLVQGAIADPEADKFSAAQTADGLNYRLFTPDNLKRNDKRPLVIWLHGNGEGGAPGHYNNESQLLANRGALGLITPEAQADFRGAYVVAPQVPDTWYNIDDAGYDLAVKALIDDLASSHQIDPTRIYLMGASAGGYMTVEMASRNPEFFAAAVPTAAALYLPGGVGYVVSEEDVLRLNSTPTWFIHAKNDAIIPYDKTSVWAHELLDDSLITLYDDVVWDGVTYNGHFSWIYTARNDPATSIGNSHKERSLWEWMSRQTTRHPGIKK